MTDDLKEYYLECRLCPRECGVNRYETAGRCSCTAELTVARIAPHYWEEPCLSGTNGSGAVFFSGCSLKCVYCQNYGISRGKGRKIGESELIDEILSLEKSGCHNINLVTASHFAPTVALVLKKAKAMGLSIPTVYNCGGYESETSLDLLDGLIDIYLPDFKYALSDAAQKYSSAFDYPRVAKKALDIMYDQVGDPVFDENGLMKKGMIVRILALPSLEENTKEALKYIKKRFGDKVYVSLMSQYTPMTQITEYPELCRKLSDSEYEELCGYAKGLRIRNGFFQEGQSASESFIPEFDEGENK